jgi:hypothetical protein
MEWCDCGDVRGAIGRGAFGTEAALRDGLARPMLRVLSLLASKVRAV